MTQSITFPELEGQWKWPRTPNPHMDDTRLECQRWFSSFEALSPEAQKSHLECDYHLISGLSYPNFSKEKLKLASHLMDLIFYFDDQLEKGGPDKVKKENDILMDAFRNPNKPRPKDEWIGGEMVKQFWTPICRISTEIFQRRFIESFDSYMSGTRQYAIDKQQGLIHDVESYFDVRRRTIGLGPYYVLLQIDMNIPEYIMDHPDITALETLATEIIFIVNDIVSYDKEQASGTDDHNLITIYMDLRGVALQEAIDLSGKLYTEKVNEFNDLYTKIPRWGGPVDLEVQTYIDGLAIWVGANTFWSFECGRYFGTRGLEIQKRGTMQLSPKKEGVV